MLLSFSFFPLFIWKLCYISSIPLVVTVSFPMLISKTVFLCCYIKARHQIVYPHKLPHFANAPCSPCGMKNFILLSLLPKVPIPNTLTYPIFSTSRFCRDHYLFFPLQYFFFKKRNSIIVALEFTIYIGHVTFYHCFLYSSPSPVLWSWFLFINYLFRSPSFLFSSNNIWQNTGDMFSDCLHVHSFFLLLSEWHFSWGVWAIAFPLSCLEVLCLHFLAAKCYK